MQHPIDIQLLPEASRKLLSGPAPLKMMAARGMAPLPPVALFCALYGLAWSDDTALRDAAAKSFAGLADAVLNVALSSPEVPGGVLDDFVTRVTKREVVDRVVGHPNVLAETVTRVAKTCAEITAELIATNEQRLLASPEIIEALYLNKNTRMSTTDRMVEFAARNGIKLNIPGFEQIVQALKGQVIPPPSEEPLPGDATFAQALDEAIEVPLDAIEEDENGALKVAEKAKKVEKTLEEMSVTEKIRTAMLGNGTQRAILIRSTNKLVSAAVLDSPKLGDDEIVKFAASRQVSEEVLRRIANKGAWMRFYEVKYNLVFNPKTPVADSLRLLPHLRDNDIKRVIGSKNVPAAVRTAAQGRMNNRKS